LPAKELELIQRIRRATARGREKVVTGIGDDCAVLDIPRGHQTLVTTDFTLEDIHFRRAWHPADSVGHRCLARGLSDIAAMGGIPRAAFLSLALPHDLPQRWVDEFLAGFLKLARRYSVPLAGGDTAQSPAGILADIVVVGAVPFGKAILRSGAHVGDIIYVSGTLGSSVATLQELRGGKKLRPSAHPRHFYPDPRISIGQLLRERKLASAMIDTSDGLSTDLRHICDESGVGATIDSAALPNIVALPHIAALRSPEDDDALQYALHGGEDYELLFTAPPNKKVPRQISGTLITRIGEITRSRQINLHAPDGKSHPLPPGGWQHFA
jgi:thiamine-monophosphate kinase